MAMNVILTQDVDHLGKAGELVSVKPGYGRNYLLPQGLAVSATVHNQNRLEHEKSQIAKRVAKERGVEVRTGEAVAEITPTRVTLKSGEVIETHTLIWAAGVKGMTLPGLEAAEVPKANRYNVDRFNQLQGVPGVYALGDVALMAEGKWERGHPGAAGFQKASLP